MTDLSYLPPLLGVVGLVTALIIYGIVRSYDAGSAELQKIADAIDQSFQTKKSIFLNNL